VFEAFLREQLEQLELLRVRAREAGLDQVDPQLVEGVSDDNDIPSPCMPSRRVVS
jgi:hypothetical protein